MTFAIRKTNPFTYPTRAATTQVYVAGGTPHRSRSHLCPSLATCVRVQSHSTCISAHELAACSGTYIRSQILMLASVPAVLQFARDTYCTQDEAAPGLESYSPASPRISHGHIDFCNRSNRTTERRAACDQFRHKSGKLKKLPYAYLRRFLSCQEHSPCGPSLHRIRCKAVFPPCSSARN
jgi:hypothetical protein